MTNIELTGDQCEFMSKFGEKTENFAEPDQWSGDPRDDFCCFGNIFC